ncbi:hypothetical protein A9Q93_00985 [Nonlabens dokdonensis]|uniref:Uncharacterized protein n=1 Tax=Nonlabens dokdonensis TaxID=328515 RepID=A0A1Z8BFX1_9FLAO|nr:hypothetical protein [Nonlabens dokdonensis]OUS21407.1 hypothetical protein A9Q93_00985 [Nonlabens dokdonensis]
MDQLDILKKNWQSQTSDTPHFSTEQLKGLLAHKSTGIVKWLFIIAMIEFFVFIILGVISHFYNQSSDIDVIGIMGKPFYYGTSILHYTVIIGFIYLFYRNYRNISVAQPTRSLMKNILKTRRTMKWYIWYNLIYIMVVGMIGMTLVIPNDPQIVALMNRPEMAGKETLMYFVFLGVSFVVFLLICIVMYLIYLLIYGILLKRLNRNYKELKRMEV